MTMELPLRLLQPFLGARIIKTGLAVFLSLGIFTWFGSSYGLFAAVAAILAIQPSVHQARELFRQQLLGNLVAGAIATALGLLLPINPLTMALGCILVLGLLNRFRLTESAGLAVVVILFIMGRPEHDFLLYTAVRLGTIAGGMAIGVLVNRFVHPPDVMARARLEIRQGFDLVDRFIHQLTVSLASPDEYQKEQIKQDAASAQRHLATARALLEMGSNGPDPQQLQILKKANGSMFVFSEAVMDIHKLALEAGGLVDERDRNVVTAALRAVQAFMGEVMRAVLDGGKPEPAAAGQFQDALAGLQRRVEELIDRQEGRTLGLQLHGMLAEIRHMGWRMASLGRLLATEGKAS